MTPKQAQALFYEFNQKGSTMVMVRAGEPLDLGMMDGYQVLRVSGDAFWLFHRPVGYHEGAHHAHTIKVISWSQEDGYEIDLVDDEDRRFHIELIFPETEPALVAHWYDWLRYKRNRRKAFALIDEGMLAEHVGIAVGWE